MSASKFNFKSSGTRKDSRKFTNINVIERSIGLKTPLEIVDDTNDVYKTHKNPADQLKDNLKNLILTNRGERLGRYEFGASLNELTFDLTAIKEYEAEANRRIISAIRQYMPAISVTNVEVVPINIDENVETSGQDSVGLALIKIRVFFDIPQMRIGNQGIEVLIYAGG